MNYKKRHSSTSNISTSKISASKTSTSKISTSVISTSIISTRGGDSGRENYRATRDEGEKIKNDGEGSSKKNIMTVDTKEERGRKYDVSPSPHAERACTPSSRLMTARQGGRPSGHNGT